jgi:putative heme-binding domain-containing protein
MRPHRLAVLSLALASLAQAAPIIVPYGPRSPQDEQKAFHLPPGFKIELVAAEPEIHKPLNIAFDDRGRLWITDTVEYPFPVTGGKKGRDTVKILDDFGPDGLARKITTFADGLCIPVGVIPHANGCIAFSIPNLWMLSDTNGDGQADQRKILMGTIGQRDTHGLTNSFTEGFDGWIYACHGFSNESHLTASDGSNITMQSGNVYRFRPDGSHVEYFTHGQVNPFGLVFDPLGDLYSADCHTMPITLLQRDGYYQSFGKPDDGLGFAPDIIDHFYGSTAIGGVEMYSADRFPAQYQTHMFVGNVMTTRINQATLVPKGSAYKGADTPDFLSCDDEWFRPTQIKLGPDGALYVGDFYNKIIGHYEVDLKNPERDRSSGRIWRISYSGPDVPAKPQTKLDLTRDSLAGLIDRLADPNRTIRMLAMNRLADTIGQPAISPLKEAIANSKSPWTKVHGLWILQRLNSLDDSLIRSLAKDTARAVRIHLIRALGETTPWKPLDRETVLAALHDPDPIAIRVAAEALGRHPDPSTLQPLLEARRNAPASDAHLIYAIRIALRNHLLLPNISIPANLPEHDERNLADVAAAAPTAAAAAFLLHHLQTFDEPNPTAQKYLKHIARYAPDDSVETLAAFASRKFASDVDLQLALFKSLQEGLTQRGGKMGDQMRNWGKSLATAILSSPRDESSDWSTHPLPDSSAWKDPWVVQMRDSADGVKAPFFCSLPNGEQLTGVIRSKNFTIPSKLSFFTAGHNGQPPAHLPIKNIIRLRNASTNEILAQSPPPRNDLAQKIEWDLSKFFGQQGYIEVTDADTGSAYAWLAFGRFSPDLIKVPANRDVYRQRLASAIDLAASLKLEDLSAPIEKLLLAANADTESRIAAAKALSSFGLEAHSAPLVTVLDSPSTPDPLREAAAASLAPSANPALATAVTESLRAAPQKLQLTLARAIAQSPAGAQTLLAAIQQGKASPRLLLDRTVKDRLSNAKPANLAALLTQLTHNLPETDPEVQKAIDQRAAAFNPSNASPARGEKVFTQNCAACHRIANQGAQIGPQLDGIGKRGPARLIEDILDPSRNVDQAFRTTNFYMTNGDAISALLRSDQGETLIIADATGKETTLPKSKIKKRAESNLSLMPSNFNDLLKGTDLDDLLSFLMSK